MTFAAVRTGLPAGKPALVPAVVYMSAEFESVPERMRTPEEAAHVKRCGELIWRVRGLEFYKHDFGDGQIGFDLVSCCCKTPVRVVPTDGTEMVRCDTCGREPWLGEVCASPGFLAGGRGAARKTPVKPPLTAPRGSGARPHLSPAGDDGRYGTAPLQRKAPSGRRAL